MSLSVEQSYTACEAIARREAKNFYYAFRVLPRPKRAAICAVYAFMRHADDLADDETLSRQDRQASTRKWLDQWHHAAAGGATQDPVFIALRDAQQRFGITTMLLDKLVQGTLMDLTAAAEHTVYPTFEDLYRYCYYVASVVGLVSIRIFGYSDPQAEELAEQTGIAFQLTNILRDVREDAERGRIYLPLEDLCQHQVTIEQLRKIDGGRKLLPNERALLQAEADRAREFYKAADRLLPLIALDSRAALWVLVRIYSRLLDRIAAADYEVLTTRINVPTSEKIAILVQGLCRALWLRLQREKQS